VLLDEGGMPDSAAPTNRLSWKAGNQMTRLISYLGKVYIEARTLPDTTPAAHTVSQISAAGIKTVCSFNPVHYVVRPDHN
jgi:hypothetical protein